MKIGQFIEANLMTIICGALVAYGGYVTGQTNTANEIKTMQSDIIALRTDLERARRVDACLSYHATRLETGRKGEVPKCMAE